MSKVVSWILRFPMWLLVIASCAASYYAAYTKLMDMTWAVPAIYTVVLVLYIVGVSMANNYTADVQIQEE